MYAVSTIQAGSNPMGASEDELVVTRSCHDTESRQA